MISIETIVLFKCQSFMILNEIEINDKEKKLRSRLTCFVERIEPRL